MKEITFEELIEDKENVNVPNFIHFNDVLELMKQVREATIAECVQTAKEELGIMSDSYFIKCVKNLPTNSIKTDL